MWTRLFLLLCLTGCVFAKEPPDVDCMIMHLKSVDCSWNKQGPPAVNYTFYSRFHSDKGISPCTTYVSENNINTRCIQPYDDQSKRFSSFFTTLVHGNQTFEKTHDLRQRVLLDPPVNLTVQNGSDLNLWFYWNQTYSKCVESEVRFRVNYKKWEASNVGTGRHHFCINLPSSSSRYELQVRSRVENNCGKSLFWSEWSEPVVWPSNNSTVTNTVNVSVSVWTALMYVVGAVTLILLVMLLLHHERLRIIPIPVVPKPSPVLYDIEDWLRFSKGLKGNFKANYNEHACPVREYSHVSQSDSESSDGSTFSVTTDQTDCSVSINVNESDDLPPHSPTSTSAVGVPSQEEQGV